jgi:type IV secretion system protein TrbE
MIKLSSILKDYKESGAVNELVNLFGFIDEHTFLTKSGELGTILRIGGKDFECLDYTDLNYIARRFEATLRIFTASFRLYQYSFKRRAANIPQSDRYDNPIVREAVTERVRHLQSAERDLYSLDTYLVVLYEGSRYTLNLGEKLKLLLKNPAAAIAAFSNEKTILLLEEQLHRAQQLLVNKINSFVIQLREFVPISVLGKADGFTFWRRLLNYNQDKAELVRLQHNTFLDYYVCDSAIECHRGYLRVDDYYVKVLTLKDSPAQTTANLLKELQRIPSESIAVSEFKRVDNYDMRKKIQSKRRHFHNSKVSMMSHLNTAPANPEDHLVDDSASAFVKELGSALTDMEVNSAYYGEFAFTIVLYDRDQQKLAKSVSEVFKVFSTVDAVLFEEYYNLLNAWLAALPGNYRYNLRHMYVSNKNYADLSFLFTPQEGEKRNDFLQAEYLAVLETNQSTPYYFNLHYGDSAHTLILGRTRSGKSFLLNFLITHLQKYSPITVIFDIAKSYEALTTTFGGSFLQIGFGAQPFTINPFSLPPTQENRQFLYSFVKVLIESSGQFKLSDKLDRELDRQIGSLYRIDKQLRRLQTLSGILPSEVSPYLARWIEGGQYGYVFDNVEDNLTFSNFQTFDFAGLRQYPEVLEPLLFYLLHRANAKFTDPALATVFKAFFFDEAWRFLRNKTVKEYIEEAAKTWAKLNAALVLATQSSVDLTSSGVLQTIAENAATLLFLSNPRIDREAYKTLFKLNDQEAAIIAGLRPKQQILVKRPDLAKVIQLNVSQRDYWIYTNSPYDNQRKREAFAKYGFERGLDFLANQKPANAEQEEKMEDEALVEGLSLAVNV